MNIIEKHQIDLSNKKETQLVSSLKIKNKDKSESIGLLLYSHSENNMEIHDVKVSNVHNIPSFYEQSFYIETLLVENENKKYIQLKRVEFSLSNYNIFVQDVTDIESVKGFVKQHIFYDVLLIEGNVLTIIENHHENTMLTYKEIKELMNKNSKRVYSVDITKDNESLSDFVFNKNYVFEYGQYIRSNKKCKQSIIEISKQKGLDFNQLQLMKLYDFYVYSNLSNEIIVNNRCIAYELPNEKSFYWLYDNKMIKEFLNSEFKLPKSYGKISDLEHLDLLTKAPLVENLWSSGSMDNFFNIRCYKKYIDSSLPTNNPFTNEMKKSLIHFYQSLSFKELQKLDVIYSKKTNALLNEKINIIENGSNEGELYISILDLFLNKDNLQTFVKNISPITTYESEKYDSLLNIRIPSEFILKEDYLFYNVLNVKNELNYLKNKKKNIDESKMVNRLYARVHRNLKDKRDYTTVYLTGNEASNLLLKVFTSREILEKSYIQLFEDITKDYGTVQDKFVANRFSYKKTNLDIFNEHLTDILEPYFLMNYIYEKKLYNKRFEPYFKKFFNTNYSNFKKFEESLRELEGVLKSGELVREIPLQSFIYPNDLNNYEMKQPKNGFELKYIGDTMRHCVFSYFDKLTSKDAKTYIVSILQENEPIVCIEVKNKSTFNKKDETFIYSEQKEITQAKLKYNSPVLNNEELNKIVCEFALLNNLSIGTRDIDVNI